VLFWVICRIYKSCRIFYACRLRCLDSFLRVTSPNLGRGKSGSFCRFAKEHKRNGITETLLCHDSSIIITGCDFSSTTFPRWSGKVERSEKEGGGGGPRGTGHRDGKWRMSQTAPTCPARIRNSSRLSADSPVGRISPFTRVECAQMFM